MTDSTNPIRFELTQVNRAGATFTGLHVAWNDIAAALGHEHQGSPEDDAHLVAMLLAAGAPSWIVEAEGWVDEAGWGAYGPAAPEYFGRRTDNGIAILHVEDGAPATRIEASVYPVGSPYSARHEHPEGIVLTPEDAVRLGIEVE